MLTSAHFKHVLSTAGEVLAILFFNLDDEQLAYLVSRPGLRSGSAFLSTLDSYAAHPQDAYDLLDALSPSAKVRHLCWGK